MRLTPSCGGQGCSLVAVCGLLIAVGSLAVEHWLYGMQPSVLAALGLSSCGHGPSCPAACGILPDQGRNACPLHWQVDSLPLDHQGSPIICVALIDLY